MYLNNHPCSTCGKRLPTMFKIKGGMLSCICADCTMQKIIDQMDFTDEDFYSRSRNERLHSMTYTQEEPCEYPQTS